MAYDLRHPAANSSQKAAPGTFSAHVRVQMKPPAHPTLGEIVENEPLVVGNVRYWRVAWFFGGEKRLTWSPESAILAA
jgi:hypothetical protein